MWMQKGMEVEDIEKIYSYPNSIPAANLQLGCAKVIQNCSSASYRKEY
jgi:hypothetical protein